MRQLVYNKNGVFTHSLKVKERKRERAQMDVAQFVRLPNGDKVVMGSTPTFHNGI